MNILITGATGFLGRSLVKSLTEDGHDIKIITRNISKASNTLEDDFNYYQWDHKTLEPPIEAINNSEIVINLMGETVGGLWLPSKKRSILQSRTLGTKNLVEAISKSDSKPKLLISASAVGYYGNRGNEKLTENSEPGGNFLSEVCKAWEDQAKSATESGLRVATLRFAPIVGPNGGFLDQQLPLAKMGLLGPLGSGKQWWPWVHIDDAISAIKYVINNQISGPLNVVSPKPIDQITFSKALAAFYNRPAIIPAPSFAIRTMLWGFADELLFSRKVIPQKLLDAGYKFKFVKINEAIKASLKR